jgi:hypothetical protein
MRRTARLAAAALCALLACRKAEAPPPPPAPLPPVEQPPVRVQEHEPNDFQRPQQLVSLRTVVAGSIESARDEDWYRLSPGPGVTVALHVEVAPAASEMAFELLDRDRNRLLRGRASPAEHGFVQAVGCTEACFIKLSGGKGGYELTVLGGPPAASAELEPNDRAVDATALTAGKPMSGTYGSGEDEDWFRLAVPSSVAGQFLRVEVSGVDGVRPELEVRALADGALLATFRAAAAGDGLFLRDLSLQLGVARPDAGAAVQSAALADAGLAAPSPADAGQVAPSPADAGPVEPGASPSGATPAEAAPDAGSALDTNVAPGADGGPALDGGSQDAAGAAQPMGATPPAPPPVAPAAAPPAAAPPLSSGGFYFGLKPTWQGKKRPANPRVPYTLLARLESGPKDLELEPNDDPQHATPLDGSASGWLAPAGDADWYRLHAAQPMVLHAEVSALERADVELSVWAPAAKPGDKPLLLARANEGGVREGEVLPAVGVPAGDSFIKIEPAARDFGGKRVRDGEDRDTLYHLTATLSPDDGSLEREPNNDAATAQQLQLPATVKGFIWPRRDVDLFRFHVAPGRGEVSVRLSAVRGVDLMLRLLEIKGGSAETIGSANAIKGEGEEQILSVPLKEGDYAVEVSSPGHKDASATQPYTLVVE